MRRTVRSGEPQVEGLAVGTKHPRQGRQGCVDLRIAIVGGAHDRGVQPERHVVHEHVTVQVGEIESAFHGVAVGVQCAHHVVAVQPEIECEVVAGPGRDDHHRQPGLRRDRCDHRLRAVPARHAEHIDAARGRIADPLEPVLARLEDHRLDPAPAAFVHEVEVLRLAAARLQVHEQHAADRGAHRRAGYIGRLERARRGSERVLRQSDGDEEQASSNRERHSERTLCAEHHNDDPDPGGDRDGAPEHPSGGDPREGDPESCDEEHEEYQMDQHAPGLIRDLSHGGDHHNRNQGDRCDRRGSLSRGGSDVGAIHGSQG